jgi:hypothetical protein
MAEVLAFEKAVANPWKEVAETRAVAMRVGAGQVPPVEFAKKPDCSEKSRPRR